MRPYSARAVQGILLTGILLLVLFHAPAPPPAQAGEGLVIGSPGFGSPGAYITWAQGVTISYTVDGPAAGNALGVYTAAQATTLFADNMFALWAGVPTANLSFTNAGAIPSVTGCTGTPGQTDFTDGDVNTVGEYNCLAANGFSSNPIIFDVDGSLIDGLRGAGASDSILGFAGPRTLGNSMSASHVAGHAVLNGKFVDGVAGTETSEENMQATALHEFGHFLGLGHSQINDHCLQALQNMTTPCANGSDDAFGLPTMYPISFSLEEAPNPPSNMPTAPAELTLSMDDIAWISLLYPGGTFAANYNTISGRLLTSDGLGPIQGGNVIARQVDDPATAGIDESLRCAVSVVSGDRFTLNLGQNVSGDNPPPPDPNAGMFFPSTGSHDPTLYGAFVIPVPNAGQGGPAACAAASTNRGMYTLQGETINSVFTGGSSVGSHGRFLGAVFPIPGTPTTLAGTLDATTGSVSNADISLNGTNPSSDAFEGGARNDSIATAAPIGNGTNTATISPMLSTGPDQDVYSFTAIANQTVTLNINAEATYTTFLDSVIEIVDGTNTRVNLCDTVTPSVFTGACMNDDDPAGGTVDSFLQFQSPTAGTFYVRVLDWRGDARVDFMYDLVVTGAGTPLSAPGCTKDFDGGPAGTGTDWNTAANWNPDGVPGAGDDVCIGAFTVNSSGANTVDTIANLTGGGTLNITGGTLTATTSVMINGGTLTLSGGALTTGTLTLSSGFLQGTGTLTGNVVQDGGEIRPGTSPGILNLTGDFTQNAGGTLRLEIFGLSGPGSPTGHDQLNVTGSATLNNGTFIVEVGGGYTPAAGDGPFTLAMVTGTVTGSNMTVFPPDPPGGMWTDAPSTATAFIVEVQAVTTCTRTFTNAGTTPGAWEDPNNWNPVGVPTGADDACVDADQFTVVITTAGQAANSLTVTGTANVFLLATGSLTLAAPSTIAGPFTIGAGTLDGAGDLTIGGVFTWAGGNMQGTGVTTANGGMNLTTGGAKTLNNGRTLNNPGMATWSDGEFFIGNGAVFNNQATGIFDIQHTGMRNLGGGVGGTSTVNNAGNMTQSAGGGTTTVNAGFNNTGTLNANDGTFQLVSAANPSANTGAFNVGAGILSFGGGTYAMNSGAAVNGSGVTLSGGSVTFNPGSSITTPVTINAGFFNLVTGGPVTLPSLTQNGGTVGGSDTLNVTGAMTWSNGLQQGSGTTNANGGLSLTTGNTKTLNNGRTLNNPGMATWSDGEFFIGNGAVFNNTSTGTFDIQHTGTRNLGGGVGGASTVNNAGTMTKSAGAGLTVVNAGFNNTGTFNANDGTFRLISAANPSTSTGAFNVGAGTLEFNNGTYDLNSPATVSGAGTITIPSGNVNFNAGSSLTAAVSQSGGVLTLATGGTVTLPTMTQTGGTVTGTGILDITGVFTWSGGDHTGAGTTNANGGLTMGTGGTKTLNNSRTLNNPGMATWTDGEFFIGNGAVFQNQATGTFDIQHTATRNLGGGVGGTSTVNNAGTMTKSAGAGLTVVNAGFNNTGTLNANDGTFRLISAANPSISTGAFNVGAGTLEFNNGTYDLNGGATVSGAGTTTIPSGTVNFNGGSSLTTAVSMTGGLLTLTTGGSVTLPTLTQSGGTVAGTDLLNITGVFTWSGGVQQGAGGVTNANGGMTLNGGGVTLNNGRTLNNTAVATWASGEFFIGNGAIFNNQATGTFNIQHGANLNLGGGVGGVSTATNAGTMTQSAGGSITTVNAGYTNTGTLNVNAGTMNFSASFTQTAGLARLGGGNLGGGITLNFNGGVLDAVGGSTITGNVNIAGATLRPGMSPGLLSIVGNYIQSATGTLDIELGGTTPGTQFDVVAITGSATLDGTLNIDPFMAFVPGGSFQIMTFASRVNNFATINNNTAGTGFAATPGTNDYVVSFAVAACNINAIASGDWANTATWSSAAVPTAADNPCIDADQFAVTVSAGAQAANSLTVTGTANPFTISGGSLDLAAASSIAGPFNQTGGTLQGAGSLTLGGLFAWSGGTQGGTGVTNANGGMSLINTGGVTTLTVARTLNNSGAATTAIGPMGILQLTVNGVFNNLMGANLQVNGAPNSIDGAGAFNNAGMVSVPGGLSIATATGTHTGAFDVVGAMSFDGGTHDLQAGSSVTGNGNLTFSAAGTVVNIAGTYNLTGATILNAAMVNFNSPASTNQLNMRPFNGTLGGTGTLTVTGLLTWEGGTMSGAGVTNANGGMLITGTDAKTLNRMLSLTGASTWSSGSLSGTGAITHAGGGTLAVNISDGSSISPAFTNMGTVTRGAGSGAAIFGGAFTNTGTVNVNTASLNFFGSFTQTAGLTTLNGGTISGALFDFNGGVLDAIGGTILTGNVNNTGATVRPGMSPGILTITGNYTQGPGGSLDIELGGTSPGNMAGNHDQLIVGGAASLNGTLNVSSSGGFTPVSGDNFSIMLYSSNPGLSDFAVKNGLNISMPPLNATPLALEYLLSVPAQADLAVTKTDAADPVVVGENITYTVTVTNNGPSAANNVVLTDTLPAGVAFVSATAPCTEAGGTVTCNLGVLANGAMTVITIVVTPGAPGILSNMASVTTTDTDPNLADNSATETTTVNQAATTTAVASSVNPSVFGENVTFTATVTVNAPGAGTPTGTVDFFDGAAMIGSGTLNAGGMATFATSTLSVGAHNITATYNGDTNFTGSTSAPLVQNVNQAATTTAVVSSANPSVFGENVTFTATVTAVGPGAGTPTGTVDFFDGAAMIGSGTLAGGVATFNTSTLSVGAHTITAVYNGDTNFTTSNSPGFAHTVNQASTSTALVSSLNPSNTGDNVTFTATVTAVAPGAGTPTGTVDFFDGAAMIGSGTLNAGGVATFSTSALTVGTHSITATYNGDTNFAASTSAPVSQVVNGVADLSLTKSDAGSDPVNVGQNIVYTVTVANGGPDAANNVVLTDTLPVAVTFVSAVPSQGGPCTLMGVTVTCPLGTINNGATANVVITVTTGALAAPSVTNTASVTTTEIDPNAANNTVSEMTTVNPVADLALTKTDSPDPVVISNNITYTLTVTNTGPSPATGIVVDDPLPANVTFVSVTAPAGSTCTTPAVGATGTVNCTLPGMLASGANVAIMIVVQAPGAAGMVTNTATVTSAITDPNAANNTATADTTVSTIIPSTDFSLTAVPINNNVIVGQSGTYTVTVGPLPAGTSFTSPISLACMSPTGTCTIAPNMLTPGANPASATMTVETAALLGSAPPAAPGLPEPGPPVSPVFALWTFLAGMMLVSLGYVGKKTQRRQLAHCLTFGLVLLVIAGAVGQSACATRVRRQVSGPYTVTVTATSGALSHSTTVTLNVTQP